MGAALSSAAGASALVQVKAASSSSTSQMVEVVLGFTGMFTSSARVRLTPVNAISGARWLLEQKGRALGGFGPSGGACADSWGITAKIAGHGTINCCLVGVSSLQFRWR